MHNYFKLLSILSVSRKGNIASDNGMSVVSGVTKLIKKIIKA